MLVDRRQPRLAAAAPRDNGLVRDDDNPVSGTVETGYRVGGARQQNQVLGPSDVATLLADDPHHGPETRQGASLCPQDSCHAIPQRMAARI